MSELKGVNDITKRDAGQGSRDHGASDQGSSDQSVRLLLEHATKTNKARITSSPNSPGGLKLSTDSLFDLDKQPVSFEQKLRKERDLFMALPAKSLEAMQDHIANHKTALAVETGVGVVVGLGLAAVSKNPAIVGKTLAPYARQSIGYMGKAMAFVAGTDWSLRLGVPAVKTWIGSGSEEENKALLGRNVGTGVLDYGAGLAGGLVGAGIGTRITPAWRNHAPQFDAQPSLSVRAASSEVKNPDAFTTVRENTVKDDVVALYERSFPKEERQPVDEIKELVQSGVIQVHTTRTTSGALKSFSMTSMHKESTKPFANLDFIATAEAERSTGIGSLHAKRLSQMVKKENPELVALTLEMEHPAEAGLEVAEQLTRARRAIFYDRLDAPDTKVKYNILDFEDPAYRGHAQWRAWVFKPESFNSVETARGMYTNEGGYGLSVRSKPVRELEKANNFYEPNQRILSLGLQSTTAQNGLSGWRSLESRVLQKSN